MASFQAAEDDDDDEGYFDMSSLMPEGSWSAEERQAYLDSLEDDENGEMPLLAESTDEMDPALVEALMQLRDGDDAPSELALAAKERGNKHFQRAASTKNKMFYREAAKEYSDGLALCRAAAHEADDEEPLALKATLLSNRAACSLVLRNYGSAIADCKAALKVDGTNAKCCYRLAKALLGLKKWEAAVKAAHWGLQLDPESKPLAQALKAATEGLANAREVARAKKVVHDERTKQYVAVFEAAAACGVTLGPSPAKGVHAYDSYPHVEQDGGLRFPIVFAYPEESDAQPDLLQSCPASDLLCEWLLTLFPEAGEGAGPDWDEAGRYVASEVSVYARLPETPPFSNAADYAAYRRKRADGDDDEETLEWQDAFLQVSPAATFLDLLAHPHYAACGVVSLEVRPNASSDHARWKAELAKRRKLRPLFPDGPGMIK